MRERERERKRKRKRGVSGPKNEGKFVVSDGGRHRGGARVRWLPEGSS